MKFKGSQKNNHSGPPKILILGAKGMLGSDLQKVFAQENIITWGKEEADITVKEDLQNKLELISPDIVINAAAYTDVDRAEKETEKAKMINGEALNYLAEICYNLDSVLVHYSTDYVFSGKKEEGYLEEEEPDPLSVYGQSKALGEKNIINSNLEKYYIIRTAWLFGPSVKILKKNFVNTILRLAQERTSLKVVDDQHGSPTYSLDLAGITKEILEKKFEAGIYHFTNQEEVTWYSFAQEIICQAQKNGILEKKNIKVRPCSSREFPRPAPRPAFSILKNTKLPLPRTWQEALKDYFHSAF
ncbi:dTDP-4-dehydrorhamnose reductase [Patescibacteria group bacterium]|nr:dTDP-4-dehydrorhamnose reductase [Patescibacteria group bacterium]